MANYALRVPESLFDYAKQLAQDERISMNQFFVSAIAEKVAVLKTDAYLRDRAKRGHLRGFDAWLSASPDAAPVAGDELLPDANRT
jgi:hypothetical protein